MTTLTNLSNSQLVDQYNEAAALLGQSSIKRFRDKQTALRRTTEILAMIEHKVAEPKAPAKPRAKRGMRFVFPFHGSDHLRSTRNAETLRGRCTALLKGGATFADVKALVEEFDREHGKPSKYVERRAYELVRIMHYYLGYGIEHNQGTDIIKLHTREVG